MIEKNSAKEKLIQGALAEIRETGVMELSLRRVAERCGLSCAAPYKHFENKEDMFRQVYEYICQQWVEKRNEITKANTGDAKNLICDLSIAFIRFLTDDPEYLRVVQKFRPRISWAEKPEGIEPFAFSRELFEQYCDSAGVDQIGRVRRLHSIRAILYGASIMFIVGETPYTVEYLGLIKFDIEQMLLNPYVQ